MKNIASKFFLSWNEVSQNPYPCVCCGYGPSIKLNLYFSMCICVYVGGGVRVHMCAHACEVRGQPKASGATPSPSLGQELSL